MLRKVLGDAWKILPGRIRARIVRTAQTKFTVSVAAVIVNETREVLLLNHVLRPFSGWGLPGGFINRGEQPDEAIRREIREEIGIELRDLDLYRVRTVRSHVEIIFSARSVGDPRVLSREIYEFGWFARDRMPEDFSLAQRFVIEKVLDRQG